MNEVPAPKYKPNQWLRFQYADGQAVSKVLAATFTSDGGWMYTVADPANPSAATQITESGVVEVAAEV